MRGMRQPALRSEDFLSLGFYPDDIAQPFVYRAKFRLA